MKKIAIMTDSNSGITQKEAAGLGISVLPMPFMINDTTYFEDINLTQEHFYEFLENDAVVSTSQPSPDSLIHIFHKLLAEYDEVVHIPMSSGLSGSCQTACMLAQEPEFAGKVFVVNNQRISVTQTQSVLDAMELAKKGYDGAQIKKILGGQVQFQHLYYAGYPFLPEKRRQDHTCGGCTRYAFKAEAGIADPGRKAGRICKSKNKVCRQVNDAAGDQK